MTKLIVKSLLNRLMLFEFVERLHDETKRAYLPAVQGFREVTGIPLPGIHPNV